MYIFNLLLLSICSPNNELTTCRNEIIDLADTIEFDIIQHPHWEHIFTIDDMNIANILRILADRLNQNFDNCPCTGICSKNDKFYEISHSGIQYNNIYSANRETKVS